MLKTLNSVNSQNSNKSKYVFFKNTQMTHNDTITSILVTQKFMIKFDITSCDSTNMSRLVSNHYMVKYSKI